MESELLEDAYTRDADAVELALTTVLLPQLSPVMQGHIRYQVAHRDDLTWVRLYSAMDSIALLLRQQLVREAVLAEKPVEVVLSEHQGIMQEDGTSVVTGQVLIDEMAASATLHEETVRKVVFPWIINVAKVVPNLFVGFRSSVSMEAVSCVDLTLTIRPKPADIDLARQWSE